MLANLRTIKISPNMIVAVSDKIPGILAHGATMAELKRELKAVMEYLVKVRK